MSKRNSNLSHSSPVQVYSTVNSDVQMPSVTITIKKQGVDPLDYDSTRANLTNIKHYQSVQRINSGSPMERSVTNFHHYQSVQPESHTQPSKFSKQMFFSKLSKTCSRNSLTLSTADARLSHKQILSPHYKPFDILRGIRKKASFNKKSPLVSQSISSFQRVPRSSRSKGSNTPSFPGPICLDFKSSMLNNNCSSNSRIQQMVSNEKDRKASKQKYLTDNAAGLFIPPYTTNQNRKSSRNLKLFAQQSSQINPQTLDDEDLCYSTEEEDRRQILEQAIQTEFSNPEEGNCCHSEGQRHQMTRYALEKALKLAEVLMKEVQRLDKIVQKYQNSDTEVETTVDSEQKTQIQAQKRELFKDIEALNQVHDSGALVDSKSSQVMNLYKKVKSQKENQKSTDSWRKPEQPNYLNLTSELLSSVTQCIESTSTHQLGRSLRN